MTPQLHLHILAIMGGGFRLKMGKAHLEEHVPGAALAWAALAVLARGGCISGVGAHTIAGARTTVGAVSSFASGWRRPTNISATGAWGLGLGMSQTQPSAWETPQAGRVADNPGNLVWGYGVEQLLDPNILQYRNRAHILSGAAPNSTLSTTPELAALYIGTGPMLADSKARKPHVARFHYMTRVLDSRPETPLVTLGMGVLHHVQKKSQCAGVLDNESLVFIKTLASHFEENGGFAGLRGRCTQKLIANSGISIANFPVMGCPSLLLNHNLGLGFHLEARYRELGAKMFVNKTCLRVGIMSHDDASDQIVLEFMQKYGCDTGNIHLMQGGPSVPKAWQQHSHAFVARTYYDPRTWAAEIRNQLDVVVGPRIHGSMIALAVGVPTLTIAHDVRIEEMCSSMRLACIGPTYVATPKSKRTAMPDAVLSAMKSFNGIAFDENRRAKATDYANRLRKIGLTIHPEIAANFVHD